MTYVDSVESDKFIYLATEPVTPLLTYLENITDSEETDMAVAWGLHQAQGCTYFYLDTKLT